MKTRNVVAWLIIFFSGGLLAQSNVQTVSSSSLSEPKPQVKRADHSQQEGVTTTFETTVLETTIDVVVDENTQFFEVKRFRNQTNVERTLEQVIIDIANIHTKMDIVNADNELKQKAISSGWFLQVAELLEKLEIEKQQLENN